MAPRVTIGVPVYRGEQFLEETLHSIRSQTFSDFQVIISVDGHDDACEAICERFLDDSRFKLVVQPKRLGWVGNLNWLLNQVETEFWYFHQQDDLTHETYLEVLIKSIERLPSAALVYCDIIALGRVNEPLLPEPAVLGNMAFVRQVTMLHHHLVAFAFRGLTRREALQAAGPIPTNSVDNYGVDIAWLAGLARWGELHHIPGNLYWKRYHDRNTESAWWAWPREKKLAAWAHHCVDMLNQALHVVGSVQEMRLLWFAGLERLTSVSTARTFVDLKELSTVDYRALLDSFLTLAENSPVHDIPRILDSDWNSIRGWTESVYWIPHETALDIVRFGPTTVKAGHPFNTQPDGSSALWLLASRALVPGTRIRLGDRNLETVTMGALATAQVPEVVVAHSGKLPLMLVGRNGEIRSNQVTFEITAPD